MEEWRGDGGTKPALVRPLLLLMGRQIAQFKQVALKLGAADPSVHVRGP